MNTGVSSLSKCDVVQGAVCSSLTSRDTAIRRSVPTHSSYQCKQRWLDYQVAPSARIGSRGLPGSFVVYSPPCIKFPGILSHLWGLDCFVSCTLTTQYRFQYNLPSKEASSRPDRAAHHAKLWLELCDRKMRRLGFTSLAQTVPARRKLPKNPSVKFEKFLKLHGNSRSSPEQITERGTLSPFNCFLLAGN